MIIFSLKLLKKTRYVRLTNYHVPDGTFAYQVSGFLVIVRETNLKPLKISNVTRTTI